MKAAHFLYLEILIECNNKFQLIMRLPIPFAMNTKFIIILYEQNLTKHNTNEDCLNCHTKKEGTGVVVP